MNDARSSPRTFEQHQQQPLSFSSRTLVLAKPNDSGNAHRARSVHLIIIFNGNCRGGNALSEGDFAHNNNNASRDDGREGNEEDENDDNDEYEDHQRMRPSRRRRITLLERDDGTTANAPLPSSLADTSPPSSSGRRSASTSTLPLPPPILLRRRRTSAAVLDQGDESLNLNVNNSEEGTRGRRFTRNWIGLIASMLEGLNETENGNDENGNDGQGVEQEAENALDEDTEALARMLYIWRTMEQTARDFDRISASYYERRERGGDEREVMTASAAGTRQRRQLPMFSGLPPPPISLFRRDASSARTTGSPPSFLSAASNSPTLSPRANGGGFVLRFPQALILAMGSERDFTNDDYDILVSLDNGGVIDKGIPTDRLDEQCPSKLFRNVETRRKIEKGELPDPCVICLEVPKPRDKVRQMPSCKHVFHSKCVERWLENHLECPCCKTPVVLGMPQVES